MTTLRFFRLIIALGLLAVRIVEAEISVCSEDGNATCLEEFRICLNDDGSEACGNCTAGFIDFRGKFGVAAGCRNITDLPWEEFYDKVKPFYRSAENVTLETRLEQLYKVLQFVSHWMAQIPPPTYSLGVNQYSADLPEDRAQLLGQRSSEDDSAGLDRFVMNRRLLQDIPTEQDWEAKGGTTYVKDQGRCGCCWAISNMGAVEGASFVTNGFIQSMSFQQLISCDGENLGCDGGNICTAMKYSVRNSFGGLATLNDYPYTDKQGTETETCQTSGKNVSLEVYSPQVVITYADSLGQSERIQYLKSATARQPVSVALKSNCNTFMSYSGGILTNDEDCACQAVTCIDHAVLLVGYNDNSNPPYWKLKNSWGEDWGEGGYFRISQDGGGRWGLFGMLGEGVMALKAVNTTGEQADEVPPNVDSWWAILLFVVAGLLVCCCAFACIKKCIPRHLAERRKHEQTEG